MDGSLDLKGGKLFPFLSSIGWVPCHKLDVVPYHRDEAIRKKFADHGMTTVGVRIDEVNDQLLMVETLLQEGWRPTGRWSWVHTGQSVVYAFDIASDCVDFRLRIG